MTIVPHLLRALALAAAIVVGLALLLRFQAGIPVREAKPRVELSGTVDFDRLFRDVTVESVARTHGRIVDRPTRLAGTAGDLEVSAFVEEQFHRLGLEVFDQSFPVTVPVTKWCRLEEIGGDAVDAGDVSLAPFWPNLVRTCTTGPEGLVGELIDGGSGRLEDLDGQSIEGKVVLLRMTRGADWLSVAKLGAKAIVFRGSNDPWHFGHKVLGFPANIPRFLASGPVDRLVGRRVRITARIDWQRRIARNVFGVLSPPAPSSGGSGASPGSSREALVMMGFTDAWSVVPDRAPGHYEACSVTALLESARALAAQRHGLARTTVFVACSGFGMGVAGPRHLMDGLGLRADFEGNVALLSKRLEEAEAGFAAAQGAVDAGREGDYWQRDTKAEAALWDRLGHDAHGAFSAVVERMIDRHIGVVGQEAASARLSWQQAGRPSDGASLDRLVDANHRLRRVQSAAGADVAALKKHFPDVLEASGCRTRLDTELATALAFARAQWQTRRDTVRVADLFAPFDRSYFFVLAPSTRGQQMSYRGDRTVGRQIDGARDAVVRRWLRGQGRDDDVSAITRQMGYAEGTSGTWTYTGRNRVFPGEKVQRSALNHIQTTFHGMVHASFVLAGTTLPEEYQTPLDMRTNHEDLAAQTQLITGLAAQVVAGGRSFLQAGGSSAHRRRWFSDFGGAVKTVGGSNSILPTRLAPDSLVVVKGMLGRNLHIEKTPTGVFRFPAVERGPDTLIADAYRLDEPSGEITAARDMGTDGQRQPYKVSEQEHYEEPETRVSLLLKRMTPTDIFQLVGPGDQPTVLQVLDADFRAPLRDYAITHDWEHGATVFAPAGTRIYLVAHNYPHYRYYGFAESTYQHVGRTTKNLLMGLGGRGSLALRSGQARDEGPFDAAGGRRGGWGPGYLVGADRRVIFQEVDAAASAAHLNRSRLASQVAGGLADAADLEMADRAERQLQSGLQALAENRYTKAYRDLSDSTAVSMRIYPRVRTAVADAVNGILFYMALLIPFSLFAERLLIGAAELRNRIIGTFAIFCSAFLLIRFTHPAYALLAAPSIVLVGFVIFMLCVLILWFIGGKFAQRLAEWRRSGPGRSGTGGDVSRSAAAAAAFSLGMNNMRKRGVRTAYTVTALVMVSFCLICFTAPRPQLLRRQIVHGRSEFEGVLLRYERQSAGHVASVRARYGDRARLVARRTAQRNWQVRYTPPGGAQRRSNLRGALYLQPEEGRVSGIDRLLLPGSHWLETDRQDVCYLSDATAAALGIEPTSVGREGIDVLLAGWSVRVAGIFDSARLEALRDLDGESLLPESSGAFKGRQRDEQRTRRISGRPTRGPVTSRHVPATEMVLLPLDAEEGGLVSSVALLFDDLPHADRQQMLDQIMNASPTFISYALDGLAYFGGRFRFAGLEFLADVVVPLAVASMIVLTTMLGSVYERRKEISVYAAVGLSPRHVLCLFLAESLVYAVIGVVGGYLLALVLQWVNHLTGGALGLNINYTGRSAMVVAATLMAAVVVSSLIPALRAARIASPSERGSWSLPPPTEPGRLAFRLPFIHAGRDALALVPYLTDWFDARAEDASGEFVASPPRIEVTWPPAGAGTPTWTVTAQTWLRPHDVGVSQEVRISVEPLASQSCDDEPGDLHVVAVELVRLSGNDASWHRTSARFVSLLRRHLLGWRAVSGRRKERLFEQAMDALQIDREGPARRIASTRAGSRGSPPSMSS